MDETRRPSPSARHSNVSNDGAAAYLGPLSGLARFRNSHSDTDADAEVGKPDSINPSRSTTSVETASPRAPTGEKPDVLEAPGPEPELLPPFRAAIRSFSSIWFLVPQGTGITSVVLFSLENRFDGLDVISYILWAFTALCLVLMLSAYSLRIAMFPRHVASLLASDAAELTCLSSISIAFTSIIQMLALSVANRVPGWATTAVVLWWVNMPLAMACMMIIPYCVTHMHSPGIASLMPNTQLPMVAAMTLAAGGGVVTNSPYLDDGERVRGPVLFFSYFCLALAVPVVMTYAIMYLVRLVEGSPPAKGKVYQEMIFCGPWSQAGFALQALGQALLKNSPGIAAYMAGGIVNEDMLDALGYGSVFLGFASWSAGTFWWAFAVLSMATHLARSLTASRRTAPAGEAADATVHEERERYSLTVWALVFPWGVYTNAAVNLGKVLASSFFRVWSTVLAICLVIIMLANMCLTIRGAWNGRLLGIDRRRRSLKRDGNSEALYT